MRDENFKQEKSKQRRRSLLGNNTIALFFKNNNDDNNNSNGFVDKNNKVSAWHLLEALRQVNRVAVNGLKLYESLWELRLCGWLAPCVLLLTGPKEDVKVVRSCWVKRSIKSPLGYLVEEFGVVQDFVIESVPQSPFLSLATALFEAVVELNHKNTYPDKHSLHEYLKRNYPDLKTPDSKTIHECLSKLIRDRRLYHNGRGYFVLRNEVVLNDTSFVATREINKNTTSYTTSSSGKTDPEHSSDQKVDSGHFSPKPLRKKKVNSFEDSNAVMKFLKRHSKRNSKKSNEEKSNTVDFEKPVACDLDRLNETQLNYTSFDTFGHPCIKRSNSFNGTDSEKSFKKTTRLGAVIKNSKDDDYFKRSFSFGAGTSKKLRVSVPKEDIDKTEVTNEIPVPDVVPIVKDEPIEEPYMFNQTFDLHDIERHSFYEDSFDLNDFLWPNKDLSPCMDNYQDLGSALSISNQPKTDANNVEDFFPPAKEKSLADEITRAFEQHQPSSEKPLLRRDHLSMLKNSYELMTPRSKRKYDRFGKVIANCDIGKEDLKKSDLKLNFYKRLDIKLPETENTNKVNILKRVSVNMDSIKPTTRVVTSTDERRKMQKERNSMLFEEKRPTLKVMGVV